MSAWACSDLTTSMSLKLLRKERELGETFPLWISEMLTQQKNTDFAPESSDWSCLT